MVTDRDIRERDKDRILRELDFVCRSIAAGYFLPGGEYEDLVQEARWGLAKAVNDFRGSGVGHFIGFAQMCIRRQVITAVKAQTRVKHEPMNGRVSAEARIGWPNAEESTVADLFCDPLADPLRIVIAREEALLLLSRITKLSPLEREAVERVMLAGEEYDAVGDRKQVDNACQRARRKLAAAPQYREAPHRTVVLVDRTVHSTEAAAIAAAMQVRRGRVVDVKPRKLRGSRVCDVRGRATRDGRLGLPVWQVELVGRAEELAA